MSPNVKHFDMDKTRQPSKPQPRLAVARRRRRGRGAALEQLLGPAVLSRTRDSVTGSRAPTRLGCHPLRFAATDAFLGWQVCHPAWTAWPAVAVNRSRARILRPSRRRCRRDGTGTLRSASPTRTRQASAACGRGARRCTRSASARNDEQASARAGRGGQPGARAERSELIALFQNLQFDRAARVGLTKQDVRRRRGRTGANANRRWVLGFRIFAKTVE